MYWILNVVLTLTLAVTTSCNLLLGLGWFLPMVRAGDWSFAKCSLSLPPLVIAGCGLVAFGCAVSNFLGIKNGRSLLLMAAIVMLAGSVLHVIFCWINAAFVLLFPCVSLGLIVVVSIAAYLASDKGFKTIEGRQASVRDLILFPLVFLLSVGLIFYWFLGVSELAMLNDPALNVGEEDLAVVPRMNRFVSTFGGDEFNANIATIQFLFMECLFTGVLLATFLGIGIMTFVSRLFTKRRPATEN